jgi:hypothetical protein
VARMTDPFQMGVMLGIFTPKVHGKGSPSALYTRA